MRQKKTQNENIHLYIIYKYDSCIKLLDVLPDIKGSKNHIIYDIWLYEIGNENGLNILHTITDISSIILPVH